MNTTNPYVSGPKISLLLCNYNNSRFLERALDNISKQTMMPYEVIALDDCSTDNSKDVLSSYIGDIPCLKVLINDVNIGIISNMNKLLSLASGDYVIFTASDDILLPCMIERYYEILKCNLECKIMFSMLATIDDKNITKVYSVLDGECYDFGGDCKVCTNINFINILKNKYVNIASNTVICSRRELLAMGGFCLDLKWHCDWFAFYAIALRHGCIMISETLALLHVDSKSYSRQGVRDTKQQKRVIYNILKSLEAPKNKDIKKIFQNTPRLFNNFGYKLCYVLFTNPKYYVFYKYLWFHYFGKIKRRIFK